MRLLEIKNNSSSRWLAAKCCVSNKTCWVYSACTAKFWKIIVLASTVCCLVILVPPKLLSDSQSVFSSPLEFDLLCDVWYRGELSLHPCMVQTSTLHSAAQKFPFQWTRLIMTSRVARKWPHRWETNMFVSLSPKSSHSPALLFLFAGEKMICRIRHDNPRWKLLQLPSNNKLI